MRGRKTFDHSISQVCQTSCNERRNASHLQSSGRLKRSYWQFEAKLKDLSDIDATIPKLQTIAMDLGTLRTTVQRLSEEQSPPPAIPSMEELAAALIPRIMEELKPELENCYALIEY